VELEHGEGESGGWWAASKSKGGNQFHMTLELWRLFDFVVPSFLATVISFNEQFGKPILSSRAKNSEAGEWLEAILSSSSCVTLACSRLLSQNFPLASLAQSRSLPLLFGDSFDCLAVTRTHTPTFTHY
jgi:hypothetical protein